jgi:Lon protease-like protein
MADTAPSADLPAAERGPPDAIPSELPILPLAGLVVYPLTVTALAVAQPASVQLIDDALRANQVVGLVALREQAAGHYAVGTAALVHRLLRLPDGALRVAAQGLARIAIEELVSSEPYPRAQVRVLPEAAAAPAEVERRSREALARLGELAQHIPGFSEELQLQLVAEEQPLRLAYLLAAGALPHSSLAERQELLELADAEQLLHRVGELLERELALARRLRLQSAPELESGRFELLERRGELLKLPIMRAAFEAGRREGFAAGQRAAIAAIIRARFGASAATEALAQQLALVADAAALDQLAALAATAHDMDTFVREFTVENSWEKGEQEGVPPY